MSALHEIQALANAKLQEHGLARMGWRFKWDNAKSRLGCCKHGTQTITMSKPIFSLADNQDKALNTILHEIAHALVGPNEGHGHTWKRKAQEIGCNAQRCDVLVAVPGMKYSGSCGCGPSHHQKGRLKRRRDGVTIATYTCLRCRQDILWRVNR